MPRPAATAGIFAGGLSETAAKGAMAGAVAVTEAVARRAAKNADEMAAKRPIAIGENMKDRVIPTATELNADYYKPRRTIGDPLRKNERWIDDKMREGREIIDIGPDPKKAQRSVFYEAEKKRTYRRDYPVTGMGN